MDIEKLAEQARQKLDDEAAKKRLSETQYLAYRQLRGVKRTSSQAKLASVRVLPEVLDVLRQASVILGVKQAKVMAEGALDKVEQLAAYAPDEASKQQLLESVKAARKRVRTDRRKTVTEAERIKRANARKRNAKLRQEYIDRINLAIANGDEEMLEELRGNII